MHFTLQEPPHSAFEFQIKKTDVDNFIAMQSTAKQLAALEGKHHHIKIDMTSTKSKLKDKFVLILSKHAFTFIKYKSNEPKETVLHIIDKSAFAWEQTLQRIHCGNIARSLASEPANILYPKAFVARTQALFKEFQNIVSIKVITGTQNLKKQKFGLIAAVGKGSSHEPCFMVIELQKQLGRERKEKTILLCGKGVCFDAGGVDLKSNSFGMHTDKTVAAIVVGLLHYFAQKDTAFEGRIVGLIPLVENLNDGNSYKPNDIFTAYNGKTVEIVDTDAEGRLILADALAYATEQWKTPTAILDFATLTHWSSTLFCDSSFTYYTCNDMLANKIEKASELVGERIIRMPKWPEYATYTKSKVADYKNAGYRCGDESSAGSGFMAAMFLSNFVPERLQSKWVHLDITHAHRIGSASISNANSFYTATELISKL